MPSKSGILLVTRAPETERAVAAAIQPSPRLELAGACPGLPELVSRLETRSAPAALVDIDPQPQEILKALEKISSRFSATRFVVLSSTLRSDLVLEAMQAGARHFLLKESIASDVVGVLHRLLPESAEARHSGSAMITLLAASGGCGATTLAVNLANEIQLATSESVLIMDLDSAYGAVSSYLDLRGQYSVADVLSSTGRIDAELIRSTALARSDKLHLLLSPASVDVSKPTALNFGALEETLEACKNAYAYTVIDAPRVPMEIAASLAAASHLTLLVFQLTVKDLQMARAIWNALAQRGITSQQVLGLANRFSRRHALVSLEDAQKALRDIHVEPINNDYRGSSLGINYGQPLAQAAPKSILRRDLERLAARIRQRNPVRYS